MQFSAPNWKKQLHLKFVRYIKLCFFKRFFILKYALFDLLTIQFIQFTVCCLVNSIKMIIVKLNTIYCVGRQFFFYLITLCARFLYKMCLLKFGATRFVHEQTFSKRLEDGGGGRDKKSRMPIWLVVKNLKYFFFLFLFDNF